MTYGTRNNRNIRYNTVVSFLPLLTLLYCHHPVGVYEGLKAPGILSLSEWFTWQVFGSIALKLYAGG